MKIGTRIPGSAWKMPFTDFCTWLKQNGFEGVDLGEPNDEQISTAHAAGLEIGTVDFRGMNGLSGDDNKAREAVVKCIAAIDYAADKGLTRLFTVLMPEEAGKGRGVNLERILQTLGPVLEHADKRGARIAMEGWPAGYPSPTLGATPETLRILFNAFPTKALGINYDPSHLIRIGVDHIRFLHEFGDRVIHCHGKDTVFDKEALYEFGTLGRTYGQCKGYGEDWWRYCIPGEGEADWGKICSILNAKGFDGYISVELEDFRYSGSWDAESLGLQRAQQYLNRFA